MVSPLKDVFGFMIVFTFALLPTTNGGFTSGEPCHERNTAILHPVRPIWPVHPVRCVDIKEMGRTPLTRYLSKIVDATTIYADDMLMTQLPVKAIRAMHNLELFDASNNKIRKLDRYTFMKNPNFTTLLLPKNKVIVPKKVPLLKSKSMMILYLSDNGIKRLTPFTFKELPALEVLFLDSNRLRRVHPKIFKPLQHLKYLHLGNNQLKVIPPKMALTRSLVTYITKGNLKRSKSDTK